MSEGEEREPAGSGADRIEEKVAELTKVGQALPRLFSEMEGISTEWRSQIPFVLRNILAVGIQ